MPCGRRSANLLDQHLEGVERTKNPTQWVSNMTQSNTSGSVDQKRKRPKTKRFEIRETLKKPKSTSARVVDGNRLLCEECFVLGSERNRSNSRERLYLLTHTAAPASKIPNDCRKHPPSPKRSSRTVTFRLLTC